MLHAKNWDNKRSAIMSTATKRDNINLNTSQCLKQLIRGARAHCLITNTDESMNRANELYPSPVSDGSKEQATIQAVNKKGHHSKKNSITKTKSATSA